MNIADRLADYGFENPSIIRITQELGESSYNTLSRIFNDLWQGEALEENERVNRMIIRYALLEGLKTKAESLTEEIISSAREKALNLANTIGTFKIEEKLEAPESVSVTPKRTRNPDLYPQIKKLVRNAPDAPRDEIVAQIVEEFGANEGTATMYFYKARKELGLKNNGKRGRKAKGS
jgi:hypothetical protein